MPYLIWRAENTEYNALLLLLLLLVLVLVVQIIVGILIGPGVLGKVFPAFYAFVFGAPVVQSPNGAAS